MSNAAKRYMQRVRESGCIVCKRGNESSLSHVVELHHVAKGSSVRSDFAVVALCSEHHRGSAGFHGMGARAFCRLYRPPFDDETGLLVWQAEDLNK